MTGKITLMNGAQVPRAFLYKTSQNLASIANQNDVLFELLEKCKDPEYQLSSNSREILKKIALIDDEDRIDDDVKAIVLHSLEGSRQSMKYTNPLRPRRISRL